MKAHVGDRIVVPAASTNGSGRDCEVLETRGPGGEPPFLVRWSDSGHTGLFFPGSDAQLQRDPAEETEPAVAAHVRSWSVSIDIFESDEQTSARAVLITDAPTHLRGTGTVGRSQRADAAEIDDEIAVARALRSLSDRLLKTAETDLAALHPHV